MQNGACKYFVTLLHFFDFYPFLHNAEKFSEAVFGHVVQRNECAVVERPGCVEIEHERHEGAAENIVLGEDDRLQHGRVDHNFTFFLQIQQTVFLDAVGLL